MRDSQRKNDLMAEAQQIREEAVAMLLDAGMPEAACKVRKAKLVWNNRARSRHGACKQRVATDPVTGEKRRIGNATVEISWNTFVLRENYTILRNTVLHELAHAATPGANHGPAWVAMARRIGCDGKRCNDAPISGLETRTCARCSEEVTVGPRAVKKLDAGVGRAEHKGCGGLLVPKGRAAPLTREEVWSNRPQRQCDRCRAFVAVGPRQVASIDSGRKTYRHICGGSILPLSHSVSVAASAPASKATLSPQIGAFTISLVHCPNPDVGGGYWDGAPGTPARTVFKVPVPHLQGAARIFRAWIEDAGLGGGNLPQEAGTVRCGDVAVARVSYNGRVWEPGAEYPAVEYLDLSREGLLAAARKAGVETA